VTFFLLVLVVGAFAQHSAERMVATLATNDAIKFPSSATVSDYVSFLDRSFVPAKEPELKAVRSYLAKLPPDKSLADSDRASIVLEFKKALADTSAIDKASVVILVLFAIGASYTVWTIFVALHSH
jgi:hypothetical protein